LGPWLIDLGGTLIDSLAVWDTCYRQAASKYGGMWPVPVKPESSSVPAWATASLGGTGCDLTTVIREIEDAAACHFAEHGFELLPGAAEFLEQLSSSRVSCALVTATPHSVAKLFTDWLGTGPFLFVVSADDVTEQKPAAEPYLLAASLMEIAPADCIAVEDSPVGVASALAAGIGTTIGVGPRHSELFELGAVATFSQLADLALLIP